MTSYAYGCPSPEKMAAASGQWWVADLEEPTIALPQDSILKQGNMYIAFFIIRDNDAAYDASPAKGTVSQSVSLVTGSAL